MKEYRIEKDSVGTMHVPKDALYGIHALRANQNFDITGHRMSRTFVKNIVLIKKAAAIVNEEAGVLPKEKADAILWACDEILTGAYRSSFIVDAVQGGAGTSANMNVNEVVANLAIRRLGGEPGDYDLINPNDDVNMAQSTNDVIPTAGKLTVLELAKRLLDSLGELYAALLRKAEEFDDVLTMGRTQLQDAVPMRMGQAFHAFAVAIERDIRRISISLHSMKKINMGATAIGTGINTETAYFENICGRLSELFGEKLSQAEDLFDGTQNIDGFAEVSGTLKTLSINLSKMCNDLRLLSSGPVTGLEEINLPARQNGSSIMPGKVNPVIPEVVNQAAFLAIGHDVTITMAAEAGQLELNAFEPVVFYQLFESLSALNGAVKTLTYHCVEGITVNREHCENLVNRSVGVITALNPYIGYKTAAEIAKESLKTGVPVKEIILSRGIMTKELLDKVLDPKRLTEPGSGDKVE